MGKEAKKKTTRIPSANRAPPDGPERSASWRYMRYCLVMLLAGVTALAWLSVMTFSPTDAPSTIQYPPPAVENAAGVVGAYLSYGLLYWLGKGALDANARAHRRVKELIEAYDALPLPHDTVRELEAIAARHAKDAGLDQLPKLTAR